MNRSRCGDWLLQSEYWARLKSEFGWQAQRLPLPDNTQDEFTVADVQVLTRRVGPFRIAYLGHAFPRRGCTPNEDGLHGDEVSPSTTARLISVAAETVRRIQPAPTLIRWDIPWPHECWSDLAARAVGWIPAPVSIQPPDTVLVDLDPDEEEILRQMKSKTRYNIRLASRRGVTVRVAAEHELPRWYRLYRETAKRDRIAIHPMEYYRKVMDLATVMRRSGEPAPTVLLLLAEHDGELVAGIITAHWNGMATYLYGASSNRKRNLMATYLLQWEAMLAARSAGCRYYDLFGIPPTDDPGHPMHGLYRFKTGFGGTVVHRPGSYDLPRRVISAGTYRTAERARSWYFHKFRKRTH